MPTRNVNLTDELEHFVQAKVESGHYENASEVIRAALRTLDREAVAPEPAKSEADTPGPTASIELGYRAIPNLSGSLPTYRSEKQYEVKLAMLRRAIDEGDTSGIASGDVFGRIRKTLNLPVE